MSALPVGYRAYAKTVRIGEGVARWEFASVAVLHWGVKTRSGFTVVAEPKADNSSTVMQDKRYWLGAQLGPFRIAEPIQVVAVIDEPERKGFAYCTLS